MVQSIPKQRFNLLPNHVSTYKQTTVQTNHQMMWKRSTILWWQVHLYHLLVKRWTEIFNDVLFWIQKFPSGKSIFYDRINCIHRPRSCHINYLFAFIMHKVDDIWKKCIKMQFHWKQKRLLADFISSPIQWSDRCTSIMQITVTVFMGHLSQQSNKWIDLFSSYFQRKNIVLLYAWAVYFNYLL